MGDVTEPNVENVTDETTTADATESKDSPEVLGEKGIEALRKEREAHKAAEAARKQTELELIEARNRLEQFESGQRNELQNAQHAAEKASEALANESKRADAAETALMRYEIAQEKGITGDALNLLVGSTREELETSADSILKVINAHKQVSAPVVQAEGRSGASLAGPEQDFANAMSAFL